MSFPQKFAWETDLTDGLMKLEKQSIFFIDTRCWWINSSYYMVDVF